MDDNYPLQPSAEWSTSYWECGGDLAICCSTFWCPCVVYAQNKRGLDGDGSSFWRDCCIFASIPIAFRLVTDMLITGLAAAAAPAAAPAAALSAVGYAGGLASAAALAAYAAPQRTRLRERDGLPAAPCGDQLSYFCCPGLSLCQEAAHLQRCQQEEAARLGGTGYGRVALAPPKEQSME